VAQLRTIRQWIRNRLLQLPGGLGERVVVPGIQRVYERFPFQNWRAKRYAASEGRRVLSELASGKNQCTIVYGGTSYGSLILTLCIARFMIAKGCMTHLVLMGGMGTHLSATATEDFYRDSQLISARLLRQESSLISRAMPDQLEEVCATGESSFLLFDDYTRAGRSWGISTLNLLNWLMAKSSRELQDEILYTYADFSDSMPQIGEGKFVSWHCRYRAVNDDRQTNTEEFLKSYSFLRSRFQDHEIVVISDEVGCKHYAELAKSLDINDVRFCKDYSTDFMGDIALIMKSEFFYVFRGGGIVCAPMCSAKPYLCIMEDLTEAMSWSRKQHTAWQREAQEYFKIQRDQHVKDRHQDLLMISSNNI